MNRFSQFVLALALLFLTTTTVHAIEPPAPKVDERVEFVSLIFRLAGAPEYNQNHYKTYTDLLSERFEQFKEHPAVEFAKELRAKFGIGQDAVMVAAISIRIDDGKIELRDGTDVDQIATDDHRWNTERFTKFAILADDFYRESKFHDFFEEQRPRFERIEKRAALYCEQIDYDWFAKFFGDDSQREFILIFNLQCEGGFGPRFKRPDGTSECFAILSPSKVDSEELPALTGNYYLLTMIVHEYSHSFSNRLVLQSWRKLLPSMNRYLRVYKATTFHKTYNQPRVVQCEIYVRATVIRYFADHEETKGRVTDYLKYEKEGGFHWIDQLVDWLTEYESRRDEFPTLESFMPELVRRQNELITPEYVAEFGIETQTPQVESFNPPNGAKNVDPKLSAVSVTFDCPMRGGCSWCSLDFNATFPKTPVDKGAQWSSDEKTCTMFVELKPNKTYNIWLNINPLYESFRSKNGDVPLKMVRYTFTTKGDERKE
ncbi:MAG: DUF4932 domain-containing protein [Thermoguttaceae bacterium]